MLHRWFAVGSPLVRRWFAVGSQGETNSIEMATA